MIFFDPNNPNKYSALKKLLVPYRIVTGGSYRAKPLSKKRCGKGDGSYVLAPELIEKDSVVLSYGIGEDPDGVSFEKEFCGAGHRVRMYDPNVNSLNSVKGLNGGTFIGEPANKDNFADHISLLKSKTDKNILKMDIEGHEYDWLTRENLKLLADNFSQFTIEVHSLIEEVPDGWVLESQMAEAKKNRDKVENFFKMLNEEFTLFHIHANNHAPRYVDFPDSLELTYINYKDAYPACVDQNQYPIKGLDEPNFDGREDYVLSWWI